MQFLGDIRNMKTCILFLFLDFDQGKCLHVRPWYLMIFYHVTALTVRQNTLLCRDSFSGGRKDEKTQGDIPFLLALPISQPI